MVVIISLILCLAGCAGNASQKKEEQLPAFDLLMSDSITHMNTASIEAGHPIALLYFSPDCEHCQEETETILKHMDSLKNVRFYFITNDPLDRLRGFNIAYGLYKHKNITVCWDNQFLFPRHFKGAFPPYLVLYDRQRRQRGIYEGGLKASQMIEIANKL